MANIVSLPADGMLLQGLIRNVSESGCFVETGLELPCGTLTEILARVDTACFRALGQVKAVHNHSGLGIEFVRLSAGAKFMLADLVEYLQRSQPLLVKSDDKQAEEDLHEPRKEESFPILRAFAQQKPRDTMVLVTHPDKRIIEARLVDDPLDLYI